MKRPKIKFKILNKTARIPSYAHSSDAGFDLRCVKDISIKKGNVKIIEFGIASEIPEGWFVSFRDRSSLAAKRGIHVLGGVIDSGYRGEWKAIMTNLGSKDFSAKKGERIAQAIIHPAPQANIVEVKNISSTTRGLGGFGSTGKK